MTSRICTGRTNGFCRTVVSKCFRFCPGNFTKKRSIAPSPAHSPLVKLIATLLALSLSSAVAVETALPTATATIHPEEPGAVIPMDFVGHSTEKKILTHDSFSPKNTTLINLCRTLGSGVLRIGANGVDSTFFQREANPAMESMKDN